MTQVAADAAGHQGALPWHQVLASSTPRSTAWSTGGSCSCTATVNGPVYQARYIYDAGEPLIDVVEHPPLGDEMQGIAVPPMEPKEQARSPVHPERERNPATWCQESCATIIVLYQAGRVARRRHMM